ncbi:hypothetical protein EMIT0P74_10156 [Pseudomonas sp. IT-P74]
MCRFIAFFAYVVNPGSTIRRDESFVCEEINVKNK